MQALRAPTQDRPGYTELRNSMAETRHSGNPEYAGRHRKLSLGEIALAYAQHLGDPELITTAQHLVSRERQSVHDAPQVERDAQGLLQGLAQHGSPETPSIANYQSPDMTQVLAPLPKQLLGAHTISHLRQHEGKLSEDDPTTILPRVQDH